MNIHDAQSIGFVICNSDEEFLYSFKRFPGATFKAWTLSPSHAHRFKTRTHANDCIRLLDHYGKLWVLDLFETPSQFLVGTQSKDRPKWLHP